MEETHFIIFTRFKRLCSHNWAHCDSRRNLVLSENMYAVYSLLLFLSFAVYIPVYFVRLKVMKGERLCLKERMGFSLPKTQSDSPALWIHAVSVGEVLSLQGLIRKIKEKHPGWIIYFSTLTNTGMRVAKDKLAEADHIFFIPLDFRCIVNKAFKRLNPRVFILAESEFWPNLLREAQRQTRGVLLINGRISSKSFKRYRKMKRLVINILKNIDHFLVQTEKEKLRLEELGIAPEHVEVAGNLKCEISLPRHDLKDLIELKKDLNIPEGKTLVLAGSTRKGEEERLCKAFAVARSKDENLLLILAPRHPERAREVEKICGTFSLQTERRTALIPDRLWDVLILDTLGELAQFYALCDMAFVGGSLVPWGGHNLLEPAFYGKPVFFGPHMENFALLAGAFVEAGAAQVVSSDEDLTAMFLNRDEDRLAHMAANASKALNSLQGATERTLQVIEEMMDELSK